MTIPPDTDSPPNKPASWKPFLAGGCLGVFAGTGLLVGGFLVAYNFFFVPSVTKMAESKELKPVRLVADYGWTLAGVDGTALEMESLKGQPVFLHLWRPECVSCVAEIPGVNALYNEFAGQGVAFVSIALEPGDDLDVALGMHDVQFPVYTLPDGKLPDFIATRGTPTTYILDKAGFIVYAHTGAVDWNTEDARAFLEQLSGE